MLAIITAAFIGSISLFIAGGTASDHKTAIRELFSTCHTDKCKNDPAAVPVLQIGKK